jgi:hypothetical protein
MRQNHRPERLSMPNAAGKLGKATKLLDVEKSDTTAAIGEISCRAAIKLIVGNDPL